jgi:hypothetical protein
LLSAALSIRAQDAASVLNRYIQVTGGADLYKRYNSLHLFYAVTHPDKTSENVDYFHTRDGKTLIETDTGSGTRDAGLSEGVVWKYSDSKGAQILSGKQAARLRALKARRDAAAQTVPAAPGAPTLKRPANPQ